MSVEEMNYTCREGSLKAAETQSKQVRKRTCDILISKYVSRLLQLFLWSGVLVVDSGFKGRSPRWKHAAQILGYFASISMSFPRLMERKHAKGAYLIR